MAKSHQPWAYRLVQNSPDTLSAELLNADGDVIAYFTDYQNVLLVLEMFEDSVRKEEKIDKLENDVEHLESVTQHLEAEITGLKEQSRPS